MSSQKKQLEIENDGLKTQIQRAEGDILRLQGEIAQQKQAHIANVENINAKQLAETAIKDAEWLAKETELKDKINQLTQDVKKKQGLLNEYELKKLAITYQDQEVEYGKDVERWVKYLGLATLLLFFSALASLFSASGKPWYDRFEYYLFDFVFVSAVWFCAAQYSYYVKLRNDYANRKTLAQSYHNILLSITDGASPEEDLINKETKKIFIDKMTDVLCAPAFSDAKEPLLTKQVVKNIVEIAKSAAKVK